MRRSVTAFLFGTGLLWAASPSFASTCALCRQALASGGNPGLIRGFYWSIVLIAGMPLVLMGAAGFLVWRHRRARHISQCPGQRML